MQDSILEFPEYLNVLFADAPVATAWLGGNGSIQWANPAFSQLLSIPLTEVGGRSLPEFVHPDERAALAVRLESELPRPGGSWQAEHRFSRRNGEAIVLRLAVCASGMADDESRGLLLQVQDLTDYRRLQRTLLEHEERWKLALRGGNHGVWDWNVKTNEAFFSSEWKCIIGYEDHELANRFEEWRDRIHPDDVEKTLASVRAYLDGLTRSYVNEHRLLGKDGIYRWILTRGEVVGRDADGSPVRFVGTHTDVTWRKHTEDSLRAQARHLSQQVMYDESTALPNRLLLNDRLRQALAYHARDHRTCALALLEIGTSDRPVDESLLRAVAHRFGGNMHGIVTMARYSPSILALLLTDVGSRSATRPMLQEFMDSLLRTEGALADLPGIVPRMGIAFGPEDARDCESLMGCAESALTAANSNGKEHIVFYDTSLRGRPEYPGPDRLS